MPELKILTSSPIVKCWAVKADNTIERQKVSKNVRGKWERSEFSNIIFSTNFLQSDYLYQIEGICHQEMSLLRTSDFAIRDESALQL